MSFKCLKTRLLSNLVFKHLTSDNTRIKNWEYTTRKLFCWNVSYHYVYFSIFAAMLQNRLHTSVAHFTMARSAVRQNRSNFSFQSILPEAYQCYFPRQGASQQSFSLLCKSPPARHSWIFCWIFVRLSRRKTISNITVVNSFVTPSKPYGNKLIPLRYITSEKR